MIHTQETIDKIRQTIKAQYLEGRTPWNKGKHWDEEIKKKISASKKGKPSNSPTKFKKGCVSINKGKSCTWMLGENNHNYKDGQSKFTVTHYRNLQYKLWRQSVFERDDYTCQKCGIRGGYLEAHHIKSSSAFPEYRYDIKNGQTLCKKCHKLTDNYCGKGIKRKKLVNIQIK